MPADKAAAALLAMSPAAAAALLAAMPTDKALALLMAMSPEERAKFLASLPPDVAARLMAAMSPAAREAALAAMGSSAAAKVLAASGAPAGSAAGSGAASASMSRSSSASGVAGGLAGAAGSGSDSPSGFGSATANFSALLPDQAGAGSQSGRQGSNDGVVWKVDYTPGNHVMCRKCFASIPDGARPAQRRAAPCLMTDCVAIVQELCASSRRAPAWRTTTSQNSSTIVRLILVLCALVYAC
jgi:hypothetical protein